MTEKSRSGGDQDGRWRLNSRRFILALGTPAQDGVIAPEGEGGQAAARAALNIDRPANEKADVTPEKMRESRN